MSMKERGGTANLLFPFFHTVLLALIVLRLEIGNSPQFWKGESGGDYRGGVEDRYSIRRVKGGFFHFFLLFCLKNFSPLQPPCIITPAAAAAAAAILAAALPMNCRILQFICSIVKNSRLNIQKIVYQSMS